MREREREREGFLPSYILIGCPDDSGCGYVHGEGGEEATGVGEEGRRRHEKEEI